MYRFTTGLVIAGLVLMFGVTRSSGEPLNPTVSDVNLNTAGGTGALETVTEPATSNTAFGFNALFSNTSGSFNTANGTSALYLNTAGIRNTATGTDALYSNTSGHFNVAMGSLALFSNTSGSFNTVNGTSALYLNTTGSRNTATGTDALYSNTTGAQNTASGVFALEANTTGAYNTATGVHALASNATGASNTAIGYLALVYSTGNKNIAVGNGAGAALASGNRNIYLGHPGATSESKTMRLGSEQTKTYIAGVTTAAVTGLNVVINASGQLGVPLSSARYKRDIETMGARSEGVLKLRPVTFAYKQDGQGLRQYGLIAEEVASVYPELVTRTATGEVQAVRYQELIPMLVNELQRLQREVEELRARVGGVGVAQR